ncbi:MAG: hypothetical protein ACR2M4_08735 [Actinomycetota bacterium]
MTVQMIRIFLASSSELEDDRRAFEIFIYRHNKDCVSKGFFLDLIIWEDFLDAVSPTRSQDEYNKAIKESDIFVMLFFTKVGRYTEEEFDVAYETFKKTNKPQIFTYSKDATISIRNIDAEVASLLAFRNKLGNLGHSHSVYRNIEGLERHFREQLNKLEKRGFFYVEPDHVHRVATNTSPNVDTVALLDKTQDTIFIHYAYDGFLYAPIFLADALNLFPGICKLSCSGGDVEAIELLDAQNDWFAICDPSCEHLHKVVPRGEDTEHVCLVGTVINVAPIWLFNTSPNVGRIKAELDLANHKAYIKRIITYPEGTTGFLFANRIRERFLKHIKRVVCVPFGQEFNDVDEKTLIVTSDILRNLCKSPRSDR